MTQTLSPRQLAEAVGVSESSLRRWADDGRVAMSRTAGGHRRIPVPEAVRMIRQMNLQVLHPRLLGLGDLPEPPADASGSQVADQLHDHLTAGRGDAARGLLLRLYLEGWPAHRLFDGPVRTSMHRIGDLWRHSNRGIAIEHRATDICNQAINQLRSLMPIPGPDAPIALGGAPAGDPYMLPTQMAAAVLADIGLHAVNLGADTPVGALLAAVEAEHPRLVWMSLSAPMQRARLLRFVEDLRDGLATHGCSLVLGGRWVQELPAADRARVTCLENFAELAGYAQRLLRA